MLVPSTFECRPTRAVSSVQTLPDELMIDWEDIPPGVTASVFMPGASADDIIAKAARLYGPQRLTRADGHTVACEAKGVTYIPIPAGSRAFAGLMTLNVPTEAPLRERCSVIVRQITTPQTAVRDAVLGSSRQLRRQVIGAFRLNVPVAGNTPLLEHEERLLAFFRWTLLILPKADRWQPVIERYVDALASRVMGLGGDPSSVYPSPVGAIGSEPESGSGGIFRAHGDQHEHTGKIVELVYDRFGDFEGFNLRTGKGDIRSFHARERKLLELARWAWQAELLVTVIADSKEPAAPVRILLQPPPSG